MPKTVKVCKRSFYIFSLIFSLLFISCFNALTPNPEDSQTQSQDTSTSVVTPSAATQLASAAKYINISGHYTSEGALPEKIAASMYPAKPEQTEEALKASGELGTLNTYYSALPVAGTTNNDVIYYALATDVNGVEQAVEGTVDTSAKTFEIKHLKLGVSWKVEVGIKVKNTVDGEDVWVRCLYDVSEPKTFTESDFTINKTFLLQPDTSGTGFVNLDMTVDSNIHGIGFSFENSTQEQNWTAAVEADTTHSINQNEIKLAGLPAGRYNITLKFYKNSNINSDYPIFSTTQSINVVSGMTTETWCSDGTSLFTGSGTSTEFNLTSDVIQDYEDTTIYVGDNCGASGLNPHVFAQDTNEGKAYSPLKSLQAAIDRIYARGNPSANYRILIAGPVDGHEDGCPDTIISNSINGKAQSITIDVTGVQADKDYYGDLYGKIIGTGSGSVLIINTNVPVTIKNITIMGGNATGNGGGISIGSDAKVTLGEGVVVTGNNASIYGGGIYNEGELTLNNATIYGCGIYNEEELTLNNAKITGNTSAQHGAGIYNKKDLVMKGGEISSNQVSGGDSYQYGGGIYNATSASCTIKGGIITLNKSNRYGGGIYNCGYLEISGGTISANTLPNAANYSLGGAGIFSNNTFAMSGGTVKNHPATGSYSGAIMITGGSFTMSGGTIEGNRTSGWSQTAGVYVSSTSATFTMTGGTIRDNVSVNTLGIPDNATGSKNEHGGAVYCKGIFKISGSAYIPNGDKDGTTGIGYNDILIPAGKKITAEGPLSKHMAADATPMAISVTNWTRGAAAIEADGAGIANLTSYLNFVNVNAEDWTAKLSADNSKIYLNAPIYVAGSSVHPTCGVAGKAPANGGDGTRSKPFDSIANACTIMDNSSLDYTIKIDGTIPAGQSVGTSVNGKAKSITITGANAVTVSNGRRIPADKIYGTSPERGSPGFIVDTSDGVNQPVPITLTNLLITNCFSASKAAGISLASGTLTLGDDLVITGNKAGSVGAGSGVYCKNDGVTFNIRGNVKIDGNTDASATPNPCNVYLGNNRIINVTGPLNKKDENGNILENANICVSMEDSPTPTQSVTFTSGYGYGSGGYNYNINPATYFHGDKWAVARNGTTNEAELAVNGGSITIDPIYQDLTINIDKYLILKTDTSKEIKFSAIGKSANGTNVSITIGSGEGKIPLTYSLSYHGEIVPSDGGYYTVGSDPRYFTFENSLPAGDYILSATAVYNGKTYSASFPVQIKEYLGSKSKTQERAVGDIIFNDGSAMPYSEYAALDDSIKNSGLRNKAIAVIYYKGTDLNNDGDTTTVRTLGVGLKQWGECFCNSMAKAFNEKITTIQCGVSGSAWNYNFTGDKKGSDNFDQIVAFFEANNITEPNFSSYYSAFNRASNYHEGRLTSENSSRISWDSEYATGWYFPTIAELFWIYKNCKIEGESKVFDIDTVMEALGGDKFENNTYLSSSQHSSTAKNIYTLTSYNISSLEKNDGRKKTCYIREF